MRWKAMRHVISKSFLSFWKKLRQNYCFKDWVLQEPLLFTLMSLVVSISPFLFFFPRKNGIIFLLYAAEKWDLMESSRNCRCFPMLQSSCRVLLSIVILYFFLHERRRTEWEILLQLQDNRTSLIKNACRGQLGASWKMKCDRMWNPGQRLKKFALKHFTQAQECSLLSTQQSQSTQTDICFFENYWSKWLGSFCEVSCELCHITALYWSKPNFFPVYGGHFLQSSNNGSCSLFSCISHWNCMLAN